MYKVYCDSDLIMSLPIEELKLVKPVVKLELNKTGSFTFTIYPTHPYYDKLQRLKSIITVYQGDYLLFRGRILNDELGFHNEKQVTCEGELAFLVDSIQRPYDFMSGDKHTTITELFSYFINNHNSQVDEAHQFKVGKITVTDANDYIVRSETEYLNTWDSINEKLIKPLGGYVWIRHEEDGNYIDYLADFDRISNQYIEFGKNLLDISQVTKGEDTATALIPLGAMIDGTEKRLTIASANDGVDYIYNQEAVEKYGWIFATKIWDDVTDAYNLKIKGQAALGLATGLANSIELSAVDLALLQKDINAFHMGTYIKVLSSPHSLNANFLVSKLKIDLTNPKANKLTLGKSFTTFTEKNLSNKGDKGEPGSNGKGVSTASIEYAKSTDNENPPEEGWSETRPTVADGEYLWVRNVYTYTDGSVSYTTPYCDQQWEDINDLIQLTEKKLESSIQTTSENILMTVDERHYLKEETDVLVSALQTSLEQTSTGFEMQFNEFTKNLQDVAEGTDAQFSEISKYIRFEDGNIILGEAGNELILKIQNDRISFIQNNNEVAYFTDKKLYVTDGEYTNSLQLGKFAFLPRSTGNLSFKKVIE